MRRLRMRNVDNKIEKFAKKRQKGRIQDTGHRRQNTDLENLLKIHVYQRSPREIGKTVISRGKSAVNFYFLRVLYLKMKIAAALRALQ